MVGAQDEVIYDGGSFVTSNQGKIVAKAHHFHEDILMFDQSLNRGFVHPTEKNKTENLRQALVVGIKDFLQKTGFKKVHLGLSGGIDSALVICLLADAIGPHNVTAIMMPGPHTSQESIDLSKKLIENLGVNSHSFEISSHYKEYVEHFSPEFKLESFGLVQENLQARLRGITLMAYSNHKSSLLIDPMTPMLDKYIRTV